MLERLDHVGIVVNDINRSLNLYTDMLGLRPWEKGIVDDTEIGVRLILLSIGAISIELIQPVRKGNRFERFLREKGEGLFHLSFFTKEYDKEVASLKAKGFKIDEEAVKELFPGYTVRLAWLKPEATRGVWIELVDMASMPDP